LITCMPLPSTNSRNSQKLTVLLFYADGNHIKETEQMERNLKGSFPDIEFFKINIGLYPKVGESFHVQQTPLTLVLHNGKEIWRQANHASPDGLFDFLTPNTGRQEKQVPEN
jgi:hypothetical protein